MIVVVVEVVAHMLIDVNVKKGPLVFDASTKKSVTHPAVKLDE